MRPRSPSWLANRSTDCLLLIVVVAVAACTSKQFTTATLYDTPHAFVRLEADPATGSGLMHSHPATVSSDQIAAVLNGIRIDEPITRMPIYDDTSIPRHHRAFDDNMIAFLAPLLSLGLGQATSEEVITFYVSRDRSGGRREVTSGGLFVQGEELHLLLANYRSPTSYMADFGAPETTDDRLTPMRALAPQQGRLTFDPSAASRTTASSLWSKFLQEDRRELVVLFQKLTPLPLSTLPAADASVR
jgi:hypothetical protein